MKQATHRKNAFALSMGIAAPVVAWIAAQIEPGMLCIEVTPKGLGALAVGMTVAARGLGELFGRGRTP